MARVIDLFLGESLTLPDGTVIRAVLPGDAERPHRAEGDARPVRRLRYALNLTQKSLAKALGCAQSSITQYESGQMTPSPEMAGKLVAFAATRGLTLTFEQIYGAVEMPAFVAANVEVGGE